MQHGQRLGLVLGGLAGLLLINATASADNNAVGVYAWLGEDVRQSLLGNGPTATLGGIHMKITDGIKNGRYVRNPVADAESDQADIMLASAAGELQVNATKLLRLNAYLARDPFQSDDYNRLLNRFSIGGHLYYLPLTLRPMAVFYNRDMFANAGIADPKPTWTWKDFSDIAERLSSVQGGQPIYGAVSFPSLWLYTLLESNDPRHMDAKSSLSVLVREKNMLAHHWFEDGRYGLFHFLNERAAMIVEPYAEGSVHLIMRKLSHVGVVPLPRLENGDNNTFIAADAVGILNTTGQPDLAWRAVRYLAGTDVANQLAQAGSLPADLTPSVAANWIHAWKIKEPGLSGLSNLLNVQPMRLTQEQEAEWWSKLYPIGSRYLAGKTTDQEAVAAIVAANRRLIADEQQAIQAQNGK